MTILLDRPVGRRERINIPDDWYYRRSFLVPRRQSPPLSLLSLSKREWRVPPAPMIPMEARPTGEVEFLLTPTGVQTIEIWRAE